jgi:hypothetical protein
MKISYQELRAFEDFIQRCEDGTERKYVFPKGHSLEGTVDFWAYYADHPHLIIPMGFDEYVSFRTKPSFKDMWFAKWLDGNGQSLYRQPSGKWFLLGSAPTRRGEDFEFDTKETVKKEMEHSADGFLPYDLTFGLDEVFTKLYSIAGDYLPEEKTIWSPRLWTPSSQENQSIILQHNTKDLLTALKSEKINLESVSWKQLEEIVAEVLRANGLEIHVVRENPQGGRDIIARGELIFGQEPLLMAVEVKHRSVVDRPEIDKALHQNRYFPALLFVTSGRFTAGVLREKALPENQFRLFLKDGNALGDLIRDYKILT